MTLRAALLTCLLTFSPTLAKTATPAPALVLQGMPVIRQTFNDCGPASIAMVLSYYGVQIPETQISLATKPTPTSYMQVSQIGRYLAPFGLEASTFSGGQVQHVTSLIRLGVPVIALQFLRGVGDIPHFRVVSGFDDQAGLLYLNDPLLGYASVSYQDFNTLWDTQGRLFVAVYPPKQHAAVMRVLGVRG